MICVPRARRSARVAGIMAHGMLKYLRVWDAAPRDISLFFINPVTTAVASGARARCVLTPTTRASRRITRARTDEHRRGRRGGPRTALCRTGQQRHQRRG